MEKRNNIFAAAFDELKRNHGIKTQKDYEVSVVSTSNGNRAVTLDRVATKLRLTVVDKVPDGCQDVKVTPDRW